MLAFAAAAFDPLMLGEFFYHPRALALVHLVTLGWITCSILGTLYLVGPVAFRMTLPATRLDGVAFACVTIGVTGMVGHFWVNSYNGMEWAAGTLLAGILLVAVRFLRGLAQAPVPAAIKLHVALAFLNILGTGVFGSLIGLQKQQALTLPGTILSNVYAHAHLAALGWATMMVMGVGYRLLPMFLPAAMPRGRVVAATALLLQTGVVGLFLGLIVNADWVWIFALVIVAALACFGVQLVWMLRHRKPPPRALPRPDLALGHTLQAFIYLLAATVLGLILLAMPASTDKLRLIFVYGVFGLLGFLAQLVVGIGARLLPMVAWMQTFVRSGFEAPKRSQYHLYDRRLQAATLLLWTIGVPALAAALYLQSHRGISLAALMLLCATISETANRILVARAWLSRAQPASPAAPGTTRSPGGTKKTTEPTRTTICGQQKNSDYVW